MCVRRCSREHDKPTISCTLLIRNFYTSLERQQQLIGGPDGGLEVRLVFSVLAYMCVPACACAVRGLDYMFATWPSSGMGARISAELLRHWWAKEAPPCMFTCNGQFHWHLEHCCGFSSLIWEAAKCANWSLNFPDGLEGR